MSAASPPNLQDWLALHGLTVQNCADLLALTPPMPAPVAPAGAAAAGLDGPALWALVASALAEALPELAPEIARTAAETVVNFAPDRARHPRPFALYIEKKAMVYVSCPLSGGARDMVIAAHEFGHALQLHCIAGAPVAPVLRETCAFLAEELLPQALTGTAPEQAGAAAEVLVRSRRRNLGPMRRDLLASLAEGAALYDYGWNYPPARILALFMQRDAPASLRRAVFHGRVTVSELIAETHV
ncbi:hypothetical protein [Marinovum sp.]|uniref:hypothetical protein n=1 Tax=Marinovum sp. TaxID=2024839 RepID=UPI002B26AB09|nr:hypothetical protein [Marinovum sp.]